MRARLATCVPSSRALAPVRPARHGQGARNRCSALPGRSKSLLGRPWGMAESFEIAAQTAPGTARAATFVRSCLKQRSRTRFGWSSPSEQLRYVLAFMCMTLLEIAFEYTCSVRLHFGRVNFRSSSLCACICTGSI